ncbi:testis anion transporter 1-like [Callithrix jacchus]
MLFFLVPSPTLISCPPGTPAGSAATVREPPVSASSAPPARRERCGIPAPHSRPRQGAGEPLPLMGDARAPGTEGGERRGQGESPGRGCVGHQQVPSQPGMAQLERSTISGFSSKSTQNPFAYDIKREVYNEESFQQKHKRKASSSGNMDINITTFRHHVQCRCSWHRFLRCMLTIFPFLEWMCMYRFKDWLLGDLLAGISVGLVQVSQGLTLSFLARQLIPPLNIAYAAFCSSVIYAILGSCHQMSIGEFNTEIHMR